jgi:hypothetical protein
MTLCTILRWRALKNLFRVSKQPRNLGTQKLGKTAKLENYQNGLVGIGRRPPKSIWINPLPLGINGFHCVECPHKMMKVLLNLAPGEPLALVQEVPCFDGSIKLDPLLASSLDLCVQNMIIGFLLHAIKVELCWSQLFFYL